MLETLDASLGFPTPQLECLAQIANGVNIHRRTNQITKALPSSLPVIMPVESESYVCFCPVLTRIDGLKGV